MTCHSPSTLAASSGGSNIVLVGNHNVGKSVIFGWLTGTYATVANYPGTTVEIMRGRSRTQPDRTVIDTPGVNSLQPLSDDERVTRDVLIDESAHAVVQVADAKNLRRALLITSQLAEAAVPLIVTLNMADEARRRGIRVDAAALSRRIGAPVVTTTATKREGLAELLAALDAPAPARALVRYDAPIEAAIARIEAVWQARHAGNALPLANLRAIAVMFLAGDPTIDEWVRSHAGAAALGDLVAVRTELQTQRAEPLSRAIQNSRTRWIDTIVPAVTQRDFGADDSLAARFGRLAVHRVWGIPILLAVLVAMYMFVGKFGAGTLVNYVEGTLFGEWINPAAVRLVRDWVPFPLVQDFLVGDYGVITVALTYGFAIILPIVFTFFIAFGILEDSGYLPRLAVMADRVFKAMGLNGKAVLPMVLGLGCDTMATMTTRTLETKKDRILVTLLLALGVPCSAQLGVVLGMLGGLDARATLIWTGVVAGVLLAVGWLAAKVVPGNTSDFILELPPIRVPRIGPLLVKTLARMEWYLKEVLPLFVGGTVLLFLLNLSGALTALKALATPLIVGWLGLPEVATEAFLIGFLRRDYGAAGFFLMAREGLLTPNQIIVALVTLTLFVPCIANFFVMVKERGWRTTLAITAFIFPFAFAAGGVLNLVLRAWS
ncbi:MAG: ferrous iron transport protein B [Chloroflexi bacterium]|nr:ferrous iron transport protein B [Chloroflexota bacterium]